MTSAPRHKTSTVSERTGLSASLLRAWERRHGLLRPERTAGGHRLYTDEDLRVLEQVQRLLGQGRSIGEVAALGRPALLGLEGGEAPAAAGSPLVGRLVEAACAVDGAAVEAALDEAFGLLGASALERVVEPALVEIGAQWAAGRCSVANTRSRRESAATGRVGRVPA